ncbi:MAG: hydrogenase nickel incorporation protein HypB [Hyphomicrobiaceae bacterium]|nr:hydrogenase nickel incorporation protein HypB [Hyphomicrobiaceae bacterium]MCC0009664.1 hydrogenase nickel incorporation protein HypB [Hyphomicrobiaceae bacterium]
MCTVCGCSDDNVKIDGKSAAGNGGQSHSNEKSEEHHHHDHHHHDHDHDHDHHNDHAHGHSQHGHHHEQHHHDYGKGSAGVSVPGMTQSRLIQVEQDILAKNNAYAAANRTFLANRAILALNLLSSPGSGKTTLLVETIRKLKGQHDVAVIEGDQQTSADAARIRETGAPAVQINTGKGCHLDGHMVGHALQDLSLQNNSILFIENVGNLVCPAAFDLGESYKVVILSVTEGEDKPLKYPDMFAAADLVLLNKIDLLPHLDFQVADAVANMRKVNPAVKVLQVSARSGNGLDQWIEWLKAALAMERVGQAGQKSHVSSAAE